MSNIENSQSSFDDSIGSNDSDLLQVETDISPQKDGKLMKTIITKGNGWEKPGNGDKVSVHYVGKLLDGTQFDSSRDRNEKFVFTLGAKEVIEGWDIAVKTMKRGEVASFKIDPSLAYGERGSPPTIPPNSTLIFEIELFDWKLEDITKKGDGGVLRRIIKDGSGWSTPNEGSTCNIEYIGKYENRVFETRQVTFYLGEGSEENLVPAIEIAVRKMKKDERCEIIVKPKYVWGDGQGNEEYGIPNDYQQLKYEINLKNFENLKEIDDMENSERIEQALLVKTKGTKYFKESKYKLAIKQYKRVLQLIGTESENFEPELKEKAREILLAGNLNLAMCYLKVENFIEAQKNCDRALEIDPENEKGLFRRGQAFYGQKEYELAKKDFGKLLEIDPKNSAAKSQMINCINRIKEHMEKEKMKYKNMFEIFAKRDSEKEAKKKAAQTTNASNDAKIFNNEGDSETMAKDSEQQQPEPTTANA
ncbi:FK506-binding protein 5 [Dermatophagoides pteronyssinus]|uniref:peptidylprolyl isomerase n=1 Tax=Dermatophagoides pteronyssinus TaxID=6956 RepID=A0ABQ8IT35_DERPT|nr:FK506-binding protein 5 [Dermatophagoides pteronyssinus]